MKLEFAAGDYVNLEVGHNCKQLVLQTEHDGPVSFNVADPEYIGVTAGAIEHTATKESHECTIDLTEFAYHCLRVDFNNEDDDLENPFGMGPLGETPYAEIRIRRLPLGVEKVA